MKKYVLQSIFQSLLSEVVGIYSMVIFLIVYYHYVLAEFAQKFETTFSWINSKYWIIILLNLLNRIKCQNIDRNQLDEHLQYENIEAFYISFTQSWKVRILSNWFYRLTSDPIKTPTSIISEKGSSKKSALCLYSCQRSCRPGIAPFVLGRFFMSSP